jgi:hypothetical protein
VEDKKWGIGVQKTDIRHPIRYDTITGLNLMGQLLMEVREAMKGVTDEPMSHINTEVTSPTPPSMSTSTSQKQASDMSDNVTTIPLTTSICIMGSSNIKYINPRRCFGKKSVTIITQSTAQRAKHTLENSQQNRDLECFILHIGLNDLRNGQSTGVVQNDLKSCLQSAVNLFPNAKIAYSEMLHVGHSDDINRSIDQIDDYCHILCSASSRMVYIEHGVLQYRDDMYEDNVHINSSSGVRTFVNDIYSVLRVDNGVRHTRTSSPRFTRPPSTHTVGETRQTYAAAVSHPYQRQRPSVDHGNSTINMYTPQMQEQPPTTNTYASPVQEQPTITYAPTVQEQPVMHAIS